MPDKGAHWDSPTSRWDTGLRWAAKEPEPSKPTKMANIALNTSRLPIADKLVRGQDIMTKSTDNPDVPGNTAVLGLFSTAQTNLDAANAKWEAHKQAGAMIMAEREAAELEWDGAIVGLAAFTQSATGGSAPKILSTGFDVRAEPAPAQPVGQVMDVRVTFNGMPGYSKVGWKREANADAYVVQRSPDPITEAGWANQGTVTEAKFEGNGVVPGQKYWYRVAAVNRLGQGPWSEPALRPVM